MKYFNKIVNVNSLDEFNHYCDIASKYYDLVYEKYENQEIAGMAYFEDGVSSFKLTFKDYIKNKKGKLISKKITYVFDKYGKVLGTMTVPQAMSKLSKAYKVQRVEDIIGISPEKGIGMDGKPIGFRYNIGSASPFRYANFEKYGGKATVAYEYDMSQAYGQMLKMPLPDITTCKKDAILKEGQIGFFIIGTTTTGNELYMTENEGTLCDYVFDKMDSPYTEFVDKIIAKIRHEKNKLANCTNNEEETRIRESINDLKNVFRYSVGQLQNINPFWRCAIVTRCTKVIKSLMDENTIYSNTDSIISATRRNDIEALKDYTFVLKHDGCLFRLAKDTMTYQWDEEVPTINGPVKLKIEYYNMTHDTPWILNINDLPEDTGSLYIAEKSSSSVKIKLNEGVKYEK